MLAALEDVVGSVASHSARKAATVKDAARPSTAGSRPGTAQRPATGTQGRHQFQPPVRLQEGTAPSKQTERLRLLGIKHFVAAAKADDDLQNCQLVATCLADVAMGLAPHLESDDLMAQPEYRERLVAWAAQECQGPKDPSAIQQAILQAMKVTPAATSSRGQISTKVPSATAKPSQPAGPVRGSWLPKVFVREFNAEGDEVEPDSGDDVFTGGAADRKSVV